MRPAHSFVRQRRCLVAVGMLFGGVAMGVTVHAPGAIEMVGGDGMDTASEAEVRFRVSGWPRRPFAVLVQGLEAASRVTLDGEPLPLAPPHRFDASAGRLTVWLDGPGTIGVWAKTSVRGDDLTLQPSSPGNQDSK